MSNGYQPKKSGGPVAGPPNQGSVGRKPEPSPDTTLNNIVDICMNGAIQTVMHVPLIGRQMKNSEDALTLYRASVVTALEEYHRFIKT